MTADTVSILKIDLRNTLKMVSCGDPYTLRRAEYILEREW